MEEIQNVKYRDSELAGCVDVTITTSKDQDIREKLFYKMAGAKCPILQMNSSTMSLEDIFLQLTENPGKAAKKLEKSRQERGKGMLPQSVGPEGENAPGTDGAKTGKKPETVEQSVEKEAECSQKEKKKSAEGVSEDGRSEESGQ